MYAYTIPDFHRKICFFISFIFKTYYLHLFMIFRDKLHCWLKYIIEISSVLNLELRC